ncbi:MAG: hypothetical protein WAO74_11380 [Polaribacter sp.]|uniref:hypothetical protein n=1 Tax=Polaribacter sp. TaxID=1920175 RepID=UPI003BAEDEA2
MDKDTIRQLFVLLITSVILYFSGNHLMSIGNLNSIFDGLVVMIFFFAFFPFLSLSLVFIGRLFRVVLSPR